MAKFYKHIWRDDRVKLEPKLPSYMLEGKPAEDLEQSIKDYYQEAGIFPYFYTLVWDEDAKTSRIMDIEEEIEERERQREVEAEEDRDELRSNIAYYGWAQAGGGRY